MGQRCSAGWSSGGDGGNEASRIPSGTTRFGAVCQPALSSPSTRMRSRPAPASRARGRDRGGRGAGEARGRQAPARIPRPLSALIAGLRVQTALAVGGRRSPLCPTSLSSPSAPLTSSPVSPLSVIPPVPSPMDFSAWFEVYLGGRWHTFDARHNTPRIGRILMAYGRDATDVAISTSFGRSSLVGFKVHTDEVRTDLALTS